MTCLEPEYPAEKLPEDQPPQDPLPEPSPEDETLEPAGRYS